MHNYKVAACKHVYSTKTKQLVNDNVGITERGGLALDKQRDGLHHIAGGTLQQES